MVYQGSKNRIAKHIIPFFEPYLDRDIYVEPFVGGANIIDKVNHPLRFGYDNNLYLIALLTYVIDGGYLPDSISEREYKLVQENKQKYPDWYVGYVGFCASYGSKFFGGYARSFKNDGVTPRDMVVERKRNLEKQRPLLKDIHFEHKPFTDLDYVGSSVLLYCDPPYSGTTKYKVDFDNTIFWEWVSKQSVYNPVYVSEYTAPDGFVKLWQREHKKTLSTNKQDLSIECLFLHERWVVT